ncbi:hypothetical protein KEX41_28625 (plasmid) [Burkholderia thailandensis]|uniref:hypothetical protein n=1 Tax=Burkholderia thailandensis TaxID=57975 RepID=UPI00192D7824|nr:hypothetical protein [Burkholderia thailandensis]MBS2132152.1 hypothetical protein [Burkholderia thailandensis]QRA15255.1 hypothetical protein JMY07_29050 [Burkholderia thailandensis]
MLAAHNFGLLSSLIAVHAPPHGGVDSSAAISRHSNAHGTGYSLVGGRFGNTTLAGFDVVDS